MLSVHSKVREGWLYLADALSRAALPHPITAQVRDFDVFRMEMESDYNARNPRLTGSLEQLFKETSKDTTLNTLYKVIVNGWPADRTDIPESLSPAGIMGTNCQWKMALFTKAPQLWYLNRCKSTCFARSMPNTLVENRPDVWHVKASFGQECTSPTKTWCM